MSLTDGPTRLEGSRPSESRNRFLTELEVDTAAPSWSNNRPRRYVETDNQD